MDRSSPSRGVEARNTVRLTSGVDGVAVWDQANGGQRGPAQTVQQRRPGHQNGHVVTTEGDTPELPPELHPEVRRT